MTTSIAYGLDLRNGCPKFRYLSRKTRSLCTYISLESRKCRRPFFYTSFQFLSIPKAHKLGIFKDEILPIEIRGKVYSEDDTIRLGVTAQSLASLKPAFPGWGNEFTTAGNASGIGDGAAICVLTTRDRAEKEGMDIVGKWVGSSVVGMCSAPIL